MLATDLSTPLSHVSLLHPFYATTMFASPQAASVSMMASKDARVSLMGELLRHLAIVKAMGWEEVLADKVRALGRMHTCDAHMRFLKHA
jgi:hypothetical protein